MSTFLRLVRNPLLFRLFLLRRLPSALFAGVRLSYVDESRCVTTIRYRWFNRNPFRSLYFACLCMAAEMSTGTLAMCHVSGRKPSVALLVVRVDSAYLRKAKGLIRFTCEDGDRIRQAVEHAVASGEAATVEARSVGTNEQGEVVAEFAVTWSFKSRESIVDSR